MTQSSEPARSAAEPEFRPRSGLRFRLWVGALGGGLVLLGGLAWIIWAPVNEGAVLLHPSLLMQLGAAGLASLIAGAGFAVWLDRGIVAMVRRLSASARANDASTLHDPLAASGWGELTDLRNHVSALIGRYRQAARSADQLQLLERQLDGIRESIQHWIETERWAALPSGAGALQGVSGALNHGFQRYFEANEQNQEAARQVQTELIAASVDARETAEQAERGFVEATSLLTTARELERLGADLDQTLGKRADAPPAAATGEWLAPVSEAVHELAGAAAASFEELGATLARVQEISDQVHVLGNRATLIALNAVLAARRGEDAASAEPADELKPLAREARLATDRVQTLVRELETQTRGAGERIQRARASVSERLSKLEPPRAAAPAPLGPDTLRALERVREMIQDATRKAERLSAAGERASRAADRLVRRLDDEVRDVEGLVVRLSPPAAIDDLRSRRRSDASAARRFDVIGSEPTAEPADGSESDTRSETREDRS